MKLLYCFLALILTMSVTLTAAPDEWIELVGKDNSGGYSLQGWNHHGNGSFLIDPASGVLTSHGGSGVLWYAGRKFADFELELEYMCDSLNTNSGVFLRIPTPPEGDDYIHNSFEIQVLGREAKDMLHANGAIYDASPATKHASREPGMWNTMNVTCRGMHYVVAINGEKVADWMAHPAGKITSVSPEGYFGLQNYYRGGAVHYRNIRVRVLDEQ